MVVIGEKKLGKGYMIEKELQSCDRESGERFKNLNYVKKKATGPLRGQRSSGRGNREELSCIFSSISLHCKMHYLGTQLFYF